ncbi:MAG: methylmalonic aciduria and homocystinuria type D protein [Calothrix sp. C42_A2020_038]|nr:methylmalonic aciduria and homocystinuria type D protein [Calothrix sp. C42_A2020_038]
MEFFKVRTSGESHLINLVGTRGYSLQISIHSPSQYIRTNRDRIFPDWKNQTSMWVVIVLAQARCEMLDTGVLVETEKQILREQFIRYGFDVAFNLRDKGYLTDLIDPRTGYPLLSRPGQFPHDDTAVVKALLGYPIIKNKCRVVLHPNWGTSVYPGILISEAPPVMIEWMLRTVACLHGWEEVNAQQPIVNT